MHLKRFSSNRIFRDKLDALVDFPQTLDMSDRVMCPEEGKSLEYELIAVDNHYGGLGGGHYTAFAKNFVDGNWYEYNDSHVTRVSDEGRVVSRAAYLLFYRRKSSKPLGGPYLEKVVQQSRVSENASSTDSESDDDNAGSASSRGTSRSRSRSSSRSRKSGAAFSSSRSESTYLPSSRNGDRERNHTNAIFGNNHTARTSPLATTTAYNAYHQRTNPTHSTASAHAHPRRTSRDGYDSLYDDDGDDDDDEDDGGVRLYGSNTRVGLSGASKQPGTPAASVLASANQPAWSFPPTPSGETAKTTSSGTRTLRNAGDFDDDEEMDVASIKSTDAQRGRDSDEEEDGTGSGDLSQQRARLSSLIDLPGSDEDEDDDMPVVELKRPEEEVML
ncbi:CSN-associated deubiquitinating enzyme Ubp12 [Ascosphaera atra]|nr:CSN-associated deubiquitinating enzyme Ubp12 [Ascosphaera atra]